MGLAEDRGGVDLTVNSLLVGASGPGQAGTSITTTESATTINVGASGTAGTLNVFPATASKGKIVISTVNNTGNTATTITNAAMGQASVISIPDPGAATANFVLDTGTAATVTATTATATNMNVGASGTAGTLKVFPTTASKGDLKITCSSQTGNTEVTVNAAAMGQATAVTLPDPGGATANFVLSTGTSTATTATSTELNTISGVTPGTVIASKALVADSGTKISGLLNSTFGAGTTSVAPINFTSGTNLTTATAGAVEYDGNAFYATSQASSRQMVDAEQYIIQATEPTADNNAGLDSASASAVFTAGSGQITLVAGKTYMFEASYMLTNTGTTSHTWATAFGGTATFNALGTAYQVYGNSGVTANTPATGGLSGFFTGATLSTVVVVTAASTSATEQVVVTLTGTISVNGGGTLIPQMKASARPGASGTPGVTHKAGSFFRIWQAPTLGTVGNWS